MTLRMQRGERITVELVNEKTAREMALVGVIPSYQGPDEEPIGHAFEMAGQRFIVTGYVTRQDFFDAVERAGLPLAPFLNCPHGMHFQKISTD